MMELIKKNIHMNRQKGNAVSQITLDDDFIIPDAMEDVSQVLLDNGEIQIESTRAQGDKVLIRGKLLFRVLYRKAGGGLQALGGEAPFDEVINVPDLEERDYIQSLWVLEDLNASMINSRKLSIKAVVTLEVRVESLSDAEAAVDIETDEAKTEVLKRNIDVAAIAVRRKDTYRLKEEITLSGTKPAIDRVLWTEMRLSGVTARPLDGKIHLEGTLMVFAIYEGEGESAMVQWVEEAIPFSGELEMQGAVEEMIPAISARLIHKGVEEKPDYDGEMRELDVDAVIELDIRLYEERQLDILSDLYATNRELEVDTGEAYFDHILTKNAGKCKIAEKVAVGGGPRALQICHSTGLVRLDEVEAKENSLVMDGALEVRILYLTDDDSRPIQSVTELLPFHYEAEVPNIRPDSVWYLETDMEQLTAAMIGGDTVEVKAVILLDMLVLQPVCQPVIRKAETGPLDTKKLQQMPGIVGYLVQEGDSLWDIAKRFHTTVENIITTNNLASDAVRPGDCLILVKEIVRA